MVVSALHPSIPWLFIVVATIGAWFTFNTYRPIHWLSPAAGIASKAAFRAFSVAGLSGRYDYETCGGGIPAQWQRFAPYLGNVPAQSGDVAYGVRYNSDDSGLDYMCGVEVGDFS